MIKIRKATKRDVESMKRVLRDAFHSRYAAAGEFYSCLELVDPNYATRTGSYYNQKMFMEDNASTIKERLNAPFSVFVAEENKKIAGYIICEKHKGKIWINDLVVENSHREKGVGKKLFDVATKRRKKIFLWVNSKNPAKKFWKKLGFKEILQETLMVKK